MYISHLLSVNKLKGTYPIKIQTSRDEYSSPILGTGKSHVCKTEQALIRDEFPNNPNFMKCSAPTGMIAIRL